MSCNSLNKGPSPAIFNLTDDFFSIHSLTNCTIPFSSEILPTNKTKSSLGNST